MLAIGLNANDADQDHWIVFGTLLAGWTIIPVLSFLAYRRRYAAELTPPVAPNTVPYRFALPFFAGNKYDEVLRIIAPLGYSDHKPVDAAVRASVSTSADVIQFAYCTAPHPRGQKPSDPPLAILRSYLLHRNK